jgi:hypothetical protein
VLHAHCARKPAHLVQRNVRRYAQSAARAAIDERIDNENSIEAERPVLNNALNR